MFTIKNNLIFKQPRKNELLKLLPFKKEKKKPLFEKKLYVQWETNAHKFYFL